jgi:hypothetical protein
MRFPVPMLALCLLGGCPHHLESPDPGHQLSPESCQLVRQVSLPEQDGLVLRVGDGFIQPTTADSETPHGVAWVALSTDGARQSKFQVSYQPAGGDEKGQASFPMGADPFAGRLVVLSTPAADGYDTTLSARSVSAGGELGALHELGPIFDRGTSLQAQALSLDGLRAVYATGHATIANPHAFVVDQDAALVAHVALLDTPDESASFTCLDAIPTQHGAAVSFVDTAGDRPVWHLIELAADGTSKASQLALDGMRDLCPAVQLTSDGFAASFAMTNDEIGVFAVRGGSVESVAQVLPELMGQLPQWVGSASNGDLLLALLDADEHLALMRVGPQGTWSWVAGGLAPGAAIHAEPDKLFLVSQPWAEDTRTLYEISCDL